MIMTHKKRLLATLNGLETDQLPFVPRMDIWYRANKKNGTLPSKYKSCSLEEILDDLNFGYHAIIPNFQDLRSKDDDIDRGLGIYRLWSMPYKACLRNVQKKVTNEADTTTVEYFTPVGNVRTKILFDESMRKAGITITHILEHAIKSSNDIEALSYIFENIEVVPNYEGYDIFKETIGEKGLAVAYTFLAASPMHFIMRDIIRIDDFFLMIFDNPERIQFLEKKIEEFYNKVFEVVNKCSAEVVLCGANYDSAVTNPIFFEKFITPTLSNLADNLHRNGKFLLTHTDGENTGLLEQYINAKIDVADSVCPSPMTKLTIKEYRQIFTNKITIWGAIPSVSLLENSMSDHQFTKYMEKLLEDIGGGDHIILSVADTLPPAAKFERILLIAKMAREFGQIRTRELVASK